MKFVIAGLAAAAALVGAGTAYSHRTGGGLQSHDVVFGGGEFDYPGTSLARDFGITARRDGRRGRGTLQYQRFVVEITCVRVEGNAGVVGGVVRSSPGDDQGTPAAMYVVDNGPPAGQSVGGDLVSPLILFAAPDEDSGGLPTTCPPVDASRASQLLQAGDISVHDRSVARER